MLDTIAGLPAHPLLVHGAVVLLPLAALLTAWLAWQPARWARLGLPVAVTDAVVFLLTFLAKESGEKLEHRLPRTDLIHDHAEVGDALPILALAMTAVAFIMWWLGRPRYDELHAQNSLFRRATGLVATLIALVVIVWTIRVGHSGAVAVWSDVK